MSSPGPTHRNALEPGHRIHWYTLDGVLGQGGFGITYLARDTNLSQRVAIKEYLPLELAVRDADRSVHPNTTDHDALYRWGLERFVSEGQTLARFDHPSIVRVLTVFEANNTAYLVMRYEEGSTLAEALKGRKTLDEDRLRGILLPLLDGLELVHAEGFIHRDIKPANIFLRADGSPVLIDFGSARQAVGQETRTLTTLVSPGFAPFEQYSNRADEQGPWTDIYSLAATMYRGVAGVPPPDAVDRSHRLHGDEPDPLVPAAQAGRDRYSPAFLETIDWGLQFRRQDRPQSISLWRGALDAGKAAQAREVTTVRAPARTDAEPSTALRPTGAGATSISEQKTVVLEEPDTPTPRSRRPVFIALAVLILGLGVAGALLLRDRSGDAPGALPEFTGIPPAASLTLPSGASGTSTTAPSSTTGTTTTAPAEPSGTTTTAPADTSGTTDSATWSAPEPSTTPPESASVSTPSAPEPAPSSPVLPESSAAADLDALLDTARQQEAAGRNIWPEGDNAFETYKKALAKDPANEAAKTGLSKLVERELRSTVEAVSNKDYYRAEKKLDRLTELAPNSKRLANIRERILEGKIKSR